MMGWEERILELKAEVRALQERAASGSVRP